MVVNFDDKVIDVVLKVLYRQPQTSILYNSCQKDLINDNLVISNPELQEVLKAANDKKYLTYEDYPGRDRCVLMQPKGIKLMHDYGSYLSFLQSESNLKSNKKIAFGLIIISLMISAIGLMAERKNLEQEAQINKLENDVMISNNNNKVQALKLDSFKAAKPCPTISGK